MTSNMKRGLRIATILVVAIAAVGIAVPYAPVDFLKAPLERALERGLGRKVEVDAVSLTLFSGPGVSLDGVTIHDDPRVGIEPFAYANTLDARISPLALLRGRLEFSSLDLNDATFNLVKPDNAPWNFQMLLNQTTPAAASLPTIKVRADALTSSSPKPSRSSISTIPTSKSRPAATVRWICAFPGCQHAPINLRKTSDTFMCLAASRLLSTSAWSSNQVHSTPWRASSTAAAQA